MSWEFEFLYALQEIHHPVTDAIMVFLSALGDGGIFWILLGVLLLIPKQYRICGFQMLLAMLLTAIIGNLVLKNLIARDRPCWIDPNVKLLISSPKDYSFPSGHSMNGFTAAVTLWCREKKIGVPALILAALIAFSRLYNFVHFPTDVLAGILIGTASALFVNWLFGKFRSKRTLGESSGR